MSETIPDDTKLNVRVYNMGVGDCIYIYIPHPNKKGKENAYHILIDCGTVSPGKNITSNALNNLKGLLPKNGSGKSRLNLLVLTHAHEDHYSGFAPGSKNLWYADFAVDRLWMSKLLDPTNLNAKKAREIGELALVGLEKFLAFESAGYSSGLRINPTLAAVAKGLIEKEDERKKILDALIAQVGKVHVEYLDTETLKAPFTLFPDCPEAAKIQVLSPTREIDKEYLGKELIQSLDYYKAILGGENPPLGVLPGGEDSKSEADLYRVIGVNGEKIQGLQPEKLTISLNDFSNLYNRMISNTFAFAMKAGDMYNITGLAILLEWKGRRLLFPADIEYTPPKSKSKDRGAWNVIWDSHVKKENKLLQYVDFLKVGHHGSDNATPWSEKKQNEDINKILDALVQDPEKIKNGEKEHPCTIVVSTERIKSYLRTMPYAPLMKELGRRAKNRVQCYDEYEGYYKPRLEVDQKNNALSKDKDYFALYKANSVAIHTLQPQRTDLYVQEPGCQNTYTDEYGKACASFIDFTFDAP